MKMTLLTATLAAVVGSTLVPALAQAAAPPAEISIPGERLFPESITSSKDGTVYIGSIGARTIYRALPGRATAEAWIKPDTVEGLKSTFGVFADDKSGTLWACSGSFGPPQPGTTPTPSTLFAFDLEKGTVKGAYPLPTPGGACNDIAVDSKGNTYITDTTNMLVLTLPKGGKTLETWAGASGDLGAKGGVLDGIAVLGDRVLVNVLVHSKFFSIPIGKDGKAGTPAELKLDRIVLRPDGMRAHGKDSLLVAESGNGGQVTLIKLDGDNGKATTLKEGIAGGPVSVTVVRDTVYVLEGQLGLMMRPAPGVVPLPFKATAVHLK